MEFHTRKARPHARIESEDLEALYPHNVMMYHLPPTQDITIDMFEGLATERLAVLRILEHASAKNLHVMSTEWKEAVIAELKSSGYKNYHRLIDGHSSSSTNAETKEKDLQARRRDYISHFILRLAYCRSVDNRRWFMAREMELFKLKFSYLNGAGIKRYLEINRLDYQPICAVEKDDVYNCLVDSTNRHSTDFFVFRYQEFDSVDEP